MRNNTGSKHQRNTQQPPRQTHQQLSREQLIFRLETLTEELEDNPNLSEQRKIRIKEDLARYNEQLNKF